MTASSLSPQSLSLSDGDVAELLDRWYGLTPIELTPMQSELSTVSRVRLGDGRCFAFKALHRTERDFAIAEWRIDAMRRLDALGIPAGATVLSRSGAPLQEATSAHGPIMVHLGAWLPGRPLEEVAATETVMRSVGTTGARVQAALSNAPMPPAFIDHPWELTRTAETIAGTRELITDRAARELVDAAASRFLGRVEPVLASLPHGVVHHDLHDSNLLIDPVTEAVTGVLDFGDMVWGPRIAELAIAAGYGGRAAADPVTAFLQIVRGWGAVAPLTADEAEVVFDAAIGRLAVNLSVWQARSDSERGEYALARSARTVRTLEAFLAADRGEVVSQVRKVTR